jgi:protein tyrosine kinase modulator
MKSSQEFELSHVLSTVYRRKDIVIAIFLVILALTSYLAASLPDIYRSSTMILITPQKLPATYVTSTVTSNIDQRMLAMTQQILSRTSLESVIRDAKLFPNDVSGTSIDQQVENLRKKIAIDVNRNDTFKLSFESESPQTAMAVTARLASLFIDENVRSREQQAAGTTAFMNAEVERLRKELEEQESVVNLYKGRHRDDLPEQLESNFRTLEQMRRELDSGMLRLTSLEERKATMEKQAIDFQQLALVAGLDDKSGGAKAILSQAGIDARTKELELLRARYSDKHPDVIRLKQEIELTVADAKARAQEAAKDPLTKKNTLVDAKTDPLVSEIVALQERNKRLQSELATYQDRVNSTPMRAIELQKITRDYDITLRKFQDLLSKEFDAQLSQNMEKDQKGGQFQVVDPASLPQTPVAPNRVRLLLLGLVLALAAALGTAFLVDNLDSSIKGNRELEDYTDSPLLAVLPVVPSRGSILEWRQARIMLLLYSAGVLVLGMFLIRLFGPMLPLR